VPSTPRQIITPEQFDAIYQALPGADVQLLIETAIGSGLRWGELTKLRVRDVGLGTRMVTVSRKAIEVNRRFQPEGTRFTVKEYPKDKEYRRLKLSPQLARKIEAHIKSEGLEPSDLLFARRAAAPPVNRIWPVSDPGWHVQHVDDGEDLAAVDGAPRGTALRQLWQCTPVTPSAGGRCRRGDRCRGRRREASSMRSTIRYVCRAGRRDSRPAGRTAACRHAAD
jgi:hypothetical protein